MNQALKAAGVTVGIATGVAVVCYFNVPMFKSAVDEFLDRFKADMKQRESELIKALSSTDSEIAAAKSVRSNRKHRHRSDEVDDDLMF